MSFPLFNYLLFISNSFKFHSSICYCLPLIFFNSYCFQFVITSFLLHFITRFSQVFLFFSTPFLFLLFTIYFSFILITQFYLLLPSTDLLQYLLLAFLNRYLRVSFPLFRYYFRYHLLFRFIFKFLFIFFLLHFITLFYQVLLLSSSLVRFNSFSLSIVFYLFLFPSNSTVLSVIAFP